MDHANPARASTGMRPGAAGGRRISQETSNLIKGLLFLSPALILFLVFVVRPTVNIVRYSLYNWNGISPNMQWLGLGNYAELLKDRIFWQAAANTVEWAGIIVVINVGVGLILAALMAQKIRGRTTFQLLHFLPVIQAQIVTAIIWRWMYQPQGAVNTFLKTIGLDTLARPWLGDFNLALPALAFASSWSSIGLSIVIFLAGLQSVDPSLYEAAEIDGANRVQSFWHVTVPALRPVTAIVLMLTLTNAFKAFDLIWATTQGGPIRATEILSTYMYKRGMLENRYGYGSAVAMVLMVVVTLFSMLYLRWQQRRDA